MASHSERRTLDARRRYRDGTLVLESDFETPEGAVRILDFMPIREGACQIIRIVEGIRGRVGMEMASSSDSTTVNGSPGFAGWKAAYMHWRERMPSSFGPRSRPLGMIRPRGRGSRSRQASRSPSCSPGTRPISRRRIPRSPGSGTRDRAMVVRVVRPMQYAGPYRNVVIRSLVTLKALTYAPTGGIVRPPPRCCRGYGGVRNWDYRYCWIRDATLTLYALMQGGYEEEAIACARMALAGGGRGPEHTQTLYGVGEERLIRIRSRPTGSLVTNDRVRFGSATPRVAQLQLDVFGELSDVLLCRTAHGTRAEPGLLGSATSPPNVR